MQHTKPLIPLSWKELTDLRKYKLPIPREEQGNDGLAGYTDYYGNVLIPFQYKEAKNFLLDHRRSQPLAIVKKLNDKYCFININGEPVFDMEFDDARRFKYNHASIKIGNKWGVINAKGIITIKPDYDYISEFRPQYSYLLANAIIDGHMTLITHINGHVWYAEHQDNAFN